MSFAPPFLLGEQYPLESVRANALGDAVSARAAPGLDGALIARQKTEGWIALVPEAHFRAAPLLGIPLALLHFAMRCGGF